MKKDYTFAVGIFLGVVLIIIGIAAAEIYYTTSKFEVGKCYESKSDNPFDTNTTRIKILQKKNGYIQYYYVLEDGSMTSPASASIRMLSLIYKECNCP